MIADLIAKFIAKIFNKKKAKEDKQSKVKSVDKDEKSDDIYPLW
tara:strand:+ start:538 stop:669 length:132 start_codon:yes stop_codon:yes gene_type:complete